MKMEKALLLGLFASTIIPSQYSIYDLHSINSLRELHEQVLVNFQIILPDELNRCFFFDKYGL